MAPLCCWFLRCFSLYLLSDIIPVSELEKKAEIRINNAREAKSSSRGASFNLCIHSFRLNYANVEQNMFWTQPFYPKTFWLNHNGWRTSSSTNLEPKKAKISRQKPVIVNRTAVKLRQPNWCLPNSKIEKISQANIDKTVLCTRCWEKISSIKTIPVDIASVSITTPIQINSKRVASINWRGGITRTSPLLILFFRWWSWTARTPAWAAAIVSIE